MAIMFITGSKFDPFRCILKVFLLAVCCKKLDMERGCVQMGLFCQMVGDRPEN